MGTSWLNPLQNQPERDPLHRFLEAVAFLHKLRQGFFHFFEGDVALSYPPRQVYEGALCAEVQGFPSIGMAELLRKLRSVSLVVGKAGLSLSLKRCGLHISLQGRFYASSSLNRPWRTLWPGPVLRFHLFQPRPGSKGFS